MFVLIKPQFKAFNTYSLHCVNRKAVPARDSGREERMPKTILLEVFEFELMICSSTTCRLVIVYSSCRQK